VTKAGTRRFFVVGTAACTALFIALTVHSHYTIVTREHARLLGDEVRRGLAVWSAYNCENCHTLLGEGSYFAPDLTGIVEQRGRAYLQSFMADPSAFYSEEEHGRLMPTLGLSEQEIDDVIDFLAWVGRIDTNGWPPRPIRVTGLPTGMPGAGRSTATEAGSTAGTGSADDAVSQGRRIFNAQGCGACHSLEPGVTMVGPSLAGVARIAEERIVAPDYGGAADSPEAYLRESVLEPHAHIAPPSGRHATGAGRSYMPDTYSDTLEPQQVDALVAYLQTLR